MSNVDRPGDEALTVLNEVLRAAAAGSAGDFATAYKSLQSHMKALSLKDRAQIEAVLGRMRCGDVPSSREMH